MAKYWSLLRHSDGRGLSDVFTWRNKSAIYYRSYRITKLDSVFVDKTYFQGLDAATIRCDQRIQHLGGHRKAIFGQREPQFIVARDHNIWETTKRLFTDGGRHNLLWRQATLIEEWEN